MEKVYIESSDKAYNRMFIDNGWELVRNPADADLIQFTGGSDVDPSLYGEEKHPTTSSNPRRDAIESHLYRSFLNEKPFAGICRGGQFLNVMNGGRMYQDVDGHAINGNHMMHLKGGAIVPVTSSHHQMMRPTKEATIFGVAYISSYKATATDTIKSEYDDEPDIEIVFYPSTRSLCFQPHPEWVDSDHLCQKTYFSLLENVLGLKGG